MTLDVILSLDYKIDVTILTSQTENELRDLYGHDSIECERCISIRSTHCYFDRWHNQGPRRRPAITSWGCRFRIPKCKF